MFVRVQKGFGPSPISSIFVFQEIESKDLLCVDGGSDVQLQRTIIFAPDLSNLCTGRQTCDDGEDVGTSGLIPNGAET